MRGPKNQTQWRFALLAVANEYTVGNLQIKAGTTPLWLCSGCLYTVLSAPGGRCHRCHLGEPKPDLSWIHAPDYQPPQLDIKKVQQIIQRSRDRGFGAGGNNKRR